MPRALASPATPGHRWKNTQTPGILMTLLSAVWESARFTRLPGGSATSVLAFLGARASAQPARVYHPRRGTGGLARCANLGYPLAARRVPARAGGMRT